MWQYNYTNNSDELYHHGVKGMKWGRRSARRETKTVDRGKARHETKTVDRDKTRQQKVAKAKRIAKGAAIAAVLVAGAYGGYKLSKAMKSKNLSIGKKAAQSLSSSDRLKQAMSERQKHVDSFNKAFDNLNRTARSASSNLNRNATHTVRRVSNTAKNSTGNMSNKAEALRRAMSERQKHINSFDNAFDNLNRVARRGR